MEKETPIKKESVIKATPRETPETIFRARTGRVPMEGENLYGDK